MTAPVWPTRFRDADVPVAPDFWDRASDRYDRQLWLERTSVRCLLALASPAPDQRLLDVATGTGAVLRELARLPSRPQSVVGVDRSQKMLERIPPLPVGWRTLRADASTLPFPDRSFDVVTAAYLLHLLDAAERASVLNELHRVLRPGAVICVVTPAIPPGGPLRPAARMLDGLAARSPERFGGLRALDPREALSAAGFEPVITRYTARGYIAMCTLARRRERR